MGGFGYGFGPRVRRRQVLQGIASAILASVLPGTGWAGTAASGFASVPVDPERTTAKPAIRLLVPPNQCFTKELLVGVYAGANANGSLLDNMGLEKVMLHYEGTTTEIRFPSWQKLTDANGKSREYFGWWAKLRHNGANGRAHAYFEAIPKNPAMQRRVIGPYLFSPQAVIHDKELQVSPSLPQVTGSRYQSLSAALVYIKGQAFQNPRITLTEPGSYILAAGGGGTISRLGYITIEATVPVSIGRPSYTTDAAATGRTGVDGLHFKGKNITLDFLNMSEVYNEGFRDHWLDGVKLTNSGGRETLWRKAGRPVAWTVRGKAWFTECDMSSVSDMGKFANLVRGCTLYNGYGDCLSASLCVVGNVVSDWDSNFFLNDVPALRVQYVGPGATATLAGIKGSSLRTFTARVDGATVGTFAVSNTEAFYTAGTNYNVSNVVDWINTLPGWSATLLDDTRNAALLVTQGLNSSLSFPETDAKTNPLTLIAEYDVHADWYQANFPGDVYDNIVIADNVTYGMIGQNLYLGKFGFVVRDVLVLNNAWHNGDYDGTFFSQFGGSHSHVVIAHNTFASQRLSFRTVGTYVADSYCIVTNNAAKDIIVNGDTALAPPIINNHLEADAVSSLGAVGSTFGGTIDSLYANPALGDFTPMGALLTNLKPASLRFDRKMKKRNASAPAGSLT